MLETMYSFLDQHILIYLSLHFIAFLVLVFMNRKTILRCFLGVSKNTWILLLIIFLIGFSLRNAEYWYGFNTDDYASLEGAKFLLVEGKYVRACANGRLGECYVYHQALQPPGASYLVSLLYLAFGINSIPVLVLSAVLSSLTIIIVFLLCYFMFKNEEIGLYSSLLFAIIPLNIFFSGTGSTRIMSIFFVALTVLFYVIAMRRNDLKAWVLFALTFSFSIYIRNENYFLSLPFLAGVLLFNYNIFRNIKKLLVAGAVFAAFQIHVFYWVFFIATNMFIHPLGLPMMSHACMIKAAPYVAWFLSGLVPIHTTLSMPYNYAATVFFVAGAGISLFYLLSMRRSRFGLFFIFLWFLVFFLAYSSYCLNFTEGLSAEPDSSYVMYSLQFHVPYSILAGYTIYLIHKGLRRGIINKILRRGIILSLIGMVVLISLLHTFPAGMFMDSRTAYESDHFAAIKKIPPNSTIITPMWMLVASDAVGGEKKSISMSTMVIKNIPDYTIRRIHESRDVYYIKPEYCEQPTNHECRFVHENLDLVHSFSEGTVDVYRVLVKPDKEYNFVWDDTIYNVTVRSNKIIKIDKESTGR